MSGVWVNIYIPVEYVKKQNERFSRIYLPNETTGAGLYFLHPSKLIRRTRSNKICSFGYNNQFKFKLYYDENGQAKIVKRSPLTPDHIKLLFADYHRSGIERLARCR